MSFSVVTAWTPDFQIFKNWIWDLEEIIKMWQELGSWIFLFLNLGTVFLALRKETMTEQTLPPALLLGIRRPEFSPHSQCKLWRCSTHSELRYLPFSKMPYSLPSLHFCLCSLLYPGMPSSASSPIKTAIYSIPNSDALHEFPNFSQKLSFLSFIMCCYISFIYLCIQVACKVLLCMH